MATFKLALVSGGKYTKEASSLEEAKREMAQLGLSHRGLCIGAALRYRLPAMTGPTGGTGITGSNEPTGQTGGVGRREVRYTDL